MPALHFCFNVKLLEYTDMSLLSKQVTDFSLLHLKESSSKLKCLLIYSALVIPHEGLTLIVHLFLELNSKLILDRQHS